MDIHQDPRTAPRSRMLMVRRLTNGWTLAAVARTQGVAVRTARKWRDRFAAEGEAALADRSSRPHRGPTRLSGHEEDEIEALRHRRMTGPAIACRLERPLSTVGVVLRRRGLGRLSALGPRPPAIRDQRERPGELIHVHTKRLGRIARLSHQVTGNRRDSIDGVDGIGWEQLETSKNLAFPGPI